MKTSIILLIIAVAIVAVTALLYWSAYAYLEMQRKAMYKNADIADAVSWETVFKNLGLNYHKKGKNFVIDDCPFCDGKHAAYVSPKHGVFKCFLCNESTSKAGLVMKIKGIGFHEAIKLLESWK